MALFEPVSILLSALALVTARFCHKSMRKLWWLVQQSDPVFTFQTTGRRLWRRSAGATSYRGTTSSSPGSSTKTWCPLPRRKTKLWVWWRGEWKCFKVILLHHVVMFCALKLKRNVLITFGQWPPDSGAHVWICLWSFSNSANNETSLAKCWFSKLFH